MSNYQDEYTRWHDRTKGSNNGWIYSAYSKYLVPNTTNHEDLVRCYDECLRSVEPLKVDRSPFDPYPPVSKDEIIGMVSLGLLSRDTLAASHWNICNLEYTPKKLTFRSFYKAAKILYKLRDEHRNYFWENEIKDTYSLAFYLPPENQYYVNKMDGTRPTIVQTIFFYINTIISLTKGDKSVKMLMWLQLSDMDHWLLRFTKQKKYVETYFEVGHPFRKGN
jgi:hypothetical protein